MPSAGCRVASAPLLFETVSKPKLILLQHDHLSPAHLIFHFPFSIFGKLVFISRLLNPFIQFRQPAEPCFQLATSSFEYRGRDRCGSLRLYRSFFFFNFFLHFQFFSGAV